jgi:hypothetical protein
MRTSLRMPQTICDHKDSQQASHYHIDWFAHARIVVRNSSTTLDQEFGDPFFENASNLFIKIGIDEAVIYVRP